MADPVIALDRVSVRYATAPSPTLRDISFRVEPGEFVGIVGSTGSGKSTLLYLLAGVIPHYLGAEISGDVLIHGRRTQELSLARISERVGLVLQDPEAQLFNLLVRDELAWGLENRGLPRAQIASRLASTLSFFRIEKLQDRITYDLSGGEKQRVALAAVHAIAPEVYLFDHPTSQLDPIGAAEVIAAVRRLAEHHAHAIVMVEDKVDELVEHADRLIPLDGGDIVVSGRAGRPGRRVGVRVPGTPAHLGLEGRGASRPERRVRRHCRSERQREDLAGPVHQRLPAPDAGHPSRRGHRGVAAPAGAAGDPGGLRLSEPGPPAVPGASLGRRGVRPPEPGRLPRPDPGVRRAGPPAARAVGQAR